MIPGDVPVRQEGFLPIAEYGAIGDGRTAALVGRDGSIDWLCWPAFDSPSVFGRLLGRDGGHFSVTVAGLRRAVRSYLPGTNVLSTRLVTDGGEVEVVDLMAAASPDGRRLQSRNALVRSVRGLGGTARVEIEFAPRFGYGAVRPRLRRASGGLVASSSEGTVGLSSTVPLEGRGETARAIHEVGSGDRIDLVATWNRDPRVISASGVDALVRETGDTWATWTQRLAYRGPHRAAVERSALALKLLDYAPTGAIVAAATTSLPEEIGGVRNWDYRFGWVRDVALSVYALRRVGCAYEAEAFLDWAFAASRCRPEDVHVLYPIEAGGDTTERTLEHLEGYRGSRPVRIGNAAAHQLQLDAFGELLDAMHLFRRGGGRITPSMWQCIRPQVDWLADNWERADFGIWEVRSEPQRFTYSTAMCHVAFDRAVRAADDLGLPAPVQRWRREGERSLRAVLEGSWSERLGAFAQTIGGDDLDAAVLALPLRRVITAGDPRMRSTVAAIRRGLDAGDGLLHRYLAPDGLPGSEGAFLLCSFWLVDCLTMQGDGDEAAELYERLLSFTNDVGLLPEEIDPSTKGFLGNFPQGFSHIGMIASAVNLARPAVPRRP